ncbi:MAG TPA: phospholipid carrier-dependent glycosyltransferase, partial [Nitriliruptoraceae bacterium]|nr:phospholipid carrier-dependent glycosyltransferase [Nitriliruptoraceae bacterium]
RSGRARLVVPIVLVAMAVVTMVVGVGSPDRIFFDEVYYVNDARDFLEFGVEDGFVVHPALGKMLIATSITIFGDTPLGWRLLGAILGAIGVWLVYDMARRLGLRIAAAGLAALALALDGVWIAQSHTAMLDIHLGFFVVLGAWALVQDRNHVRRADDAALAAAAAPLSVPVPAVAGSAAAAAAVATTSAATTTSAASGVPNSRADGIESTPPRLRSLPRPGRWWLVLAGVSFGAGVAVKWSGALALVAAGIVVAGWELARRRLLLGSARDQPWSWLGLGLGALVLVPLAVYAVSWIPWFVAFDNTYMASGPCANADNDLDCDGLGRVGALVDYHDRMFDFHINLDADHAYREPATGWPIQHRPVVYYYETCSDNRNDRVPQTDSDGVVTTPEPCTVPQGSAAEIMSLGNPAVWWTLLASLPLLGAALRRRSPAAWMAVTFILVQFVPWLGPSRPVFNFYTVPLVPFVALALAIAVDEVTSWRDGWRAWVVGTATGVTLAATLVAVAEFTTLHVDWVLGWYLVGITAAAGGAMMGTDTSRVATGWASTAGATQAGDTRRVWPTVTVAAVVVAVAVYFMPVWWGVTMPTWFVRAHWWLSSWV